MSEGVADERHAEQPEELNSESFYDDQVEPSSLAHSTAGTTQVCHDTPATYTESPTSAILPGRNDNSSSRPGSAPPMITCNTHADGGSSSKPKNQSVLKPRNEDNRVKKSAQSTRRSPSPSLRDELVTLSLPHNAEDIEEALLYLIGQNRRRAESEKGLKKACHNLETEKQALKDLHNIQQQELVNAQQQWQTAIQNNHVRDAEVRDLRSKYENLKKAVQSFAQTSEDVKKGRDKLDQELKSLQGLNSSTAKTNAEAFRQCVTADDQVTRIKGEISTLRRDHEKLAEMRTGLLEAQEYLREEKYKNKKYEMHIQRLEEAQRVWHTRSDSNQTEALSQLNSLMRLITRQSSEQALGDYMQPLAETLEEIQQCLQELATAEKSKSLSSDEKLRFEGISNALENVRKALEDQHAAADLQFSNVVSFLSDMKPDSTHLEQLGKDKARLEQEVLAGKQTNLDLKKSQISSQLMCTALLEHHNQLLSREKDAATIARTVQDLIVSKNLAIHQSSLKQQENEALQADLQQKADDLTRAKQEMISFQNQNRLNVDKTAKLHEDEISKVRESYANDQRKLELSITKERQLHDEDRKTFQEAKSKLVDYEKNAESAQNQIRSQNARFAQQEKYIIMLKTEKQTMQACLSELRDIEQEKEVMSRLIKKIEADLQGKLNELQQVNVDSASQKSQISILKDNLGDVQQKLSAIEAEKERLKRDLNAKQKEHIERMSSLNGSIASALQANTRLQQDLDRSKLAESTARKVNEDLVGREAHLQKQLEDKEKQISDVQKRESFQRAENYRLEQDIQTTRKEHGETQILCSELSKKNDEQGDKIKSLEEEVATLRNAAADLEAVKAILLDKDAEATQHRIRCENLQQELLRFGPMREYISDAEIDELTEPIILSLKSQINASQLQTQKDCMGPPTRPDLTETDASKSHREEARSGISEVVIPDSQSQGFVLGQVQDFDRSASPELIDTSNDILADIDLHTQASGNHLHPTSDAIQHLGEAFRPGTSNDEMLLRSPDAPSELLENPHRSVVLVPASSYPISPMKTRNGSQIRHTVAEMQVNPVKQRESTPSSQQKNDHAPNSAAKRQNTADEADLPGKKPRLQQANLRSTEIRSASRPAILTPKQTRFADQPTMYPAASTTSKNASIAGTSAPAPAPGSMRKRTNAPKRNSRNTAFEGRFT